MTRARDLMTPEPACVKEQQTLAEAARIMRDLDIGSMPICGDDDRLTGMLTDRDIVVKCVALGGAPNAVTAGELADGTPITIGADDDVREALRLMQQHRIRRLPVIDRGLLVGVIAQADVALALDADETAETVEEISQP
ncbi:CBS domain-containing protein [Agromyces arachidis]|uniref:CBS domain-containing protein n=1 Tax=Agromyces arachidis TaxID=766966 RepID=UPI004055BE7F